MSGRSPAGVAREARRARSSSSLVGQVGADGECVTGHPAMWAMNPVFELGRMPEGGGYPVGFVETAAKLMGCRDLDAIVHLCSGSVRARFTFDARPGTGCAVVADVRWLPIRPGAVSWILVDPPYGDDYAEALWGLGKIYPTPAVLLRECAEVLRPGGRVGFLHQIVPRLPAGLERIGTYAISTGPGYRMRAFTVAERTAAQLVLGEDGVDHGA